MSVTDLDDVNQKVVYIPFSPPDDNNDEHTNQSSAYNPFQDRDLPGGLDLRMEAYRIAWNKCLKRTQEIISSIHAPVVDAVVRDVRTAYSNVLPGLPYSEILVISLTTHAAGPSIIDEILGRLDPPRGEKDFEDGSDTDSLFHTSTPEAFVTHLYPSECTSVMMAMKALITGFVQSRLNQNDESKKRRPTMSLAVYDINLLEAWYEVVREAHGSDQDFLPQLVVMLYDFEQFDPAVVQDMLYICSLHVPRLPLVFIFCMSSPPSPSYLRSAYPRSTLSLLRVRNFSVKSGGEVLGELLTKLFFDVDFEPDIVLGSSALSFLVEHFTQRNSSVDALITVLQLAHMKHFQEPLTIFVHDSLLGTHRRDLAIDKLLQPQSFAFLDSIIARLHNPGVDPPIDHATRWLNQDIPSLLNSIDEARQELRMQARRLRVAFRVMTVVRAFMLRCGYKSAGSERTVPEMMIAIMSGKPGKDAKYLGTMVKKLYSVQLTALVGELREKVPTCLSDDEAFLTRIATSATTSPNDDPATARRLAEEFGEWLTNYFRESFISLEETELWDVWYTGLTPFLSELINPSIRTTILSGLLYPLDYTHSDRTDDNDKADEPEALWQLPDTSILFHRYLESGKMINVYDWFESFAVVLEDQRRRTKAKTTTSPRKSVSPRKGKGKGKGKRNRAVISDDDDDDGEEEDENWTAEDLEKWKMEVHARFIRALHELDYLGLIKHTGRKADHVIRTVFEAAD